MVAAGAAAAPGARGNLGSMMCRWESQASGGTCAAGRAVPDEWGIGRSFDCFTRLSIYPFSFARGGTCMRFDSAIHVSDCRPEYFAGMLAEGWRGIRWRRG